MTYTSIEFLKLLAVGTSTTAGVLTVYSCFSASPEGMPLEEILKKWPRNLSFQMHNATNPDQQGTIEYNLQSNEKIGDYEPRLSLTSENGSLDSFKGTLEFAYTGSDANLKDGPTFDLDFVEDKSTTKFSTFGATKRLTLKHESKFAREPPPGYSLGFYIELKESPLEGVAYQPIGLVDKYPDKDKLQTGQIS